MNGDCWGSGGRLGRPDDAGIAARIPTQPEGSHQTCGCTSEHDRKPLEGAKYKCDLHFKKMIGRSVDGAVEGTGVKEAGQLGGHYNCPMCRTLALESDR